MTNVSNLTTEFTDSAHPDYFGYFFVPTVFVIGIVGNSLTVRIMLSKGFQNMPVSKMLVVLALSDMATILLLPLNISFVVDWLGTDVRILSSASCKLYYWSYRFFRILSSWMLVLITCERFVAAWMPKRAKLVSTVRNAYVAISSVAVVLVVFTGVWSLLTDRLSDGQCHFNFIEAEVIEVGWALTVCGTLIYVVIPSVLLIILNSLLAYKLVVLRKKKASLVAPVDGSKPASNGFNRNSHNNRRIYAMLLCITICFVILASPMSYLHVVSLAHPKSIYLINNPTIIHVRDVAQKFEQLNHSISFILYVLSSNRFREKLVDIFRRKPNNPKEVTTRTATP